MKMNVFYTLNDAYVPHLAASICSLCENNRQAETIHFFVLSMGIRPQNLQRLQELVQRYGRGLTVSEFGDVAQKFQFPIDTRGFDVSVLARLFVGSVLPQTVDRALYLDCDTIVLDALEDLWQTDLSHCLLGAVMEPTVEKSRKTSLGLAPSDPYFNSGVLLFNLQAWREQQAERAVVEYYASKGGSLIAPDQDAINGAFTGRIKELSPRYNYGTIEIYYPYKTLKKIAAPAPYLPEAEYNRAKRRPAIIHYLGEERPWRKGSTHPFTKHYEQYLAMTPWQDTPKEEGWQAYFFFFRIFNAVTKPCRMLRYRIINALIPAFMRRRAKQRTQQKER